ncbi:PP2C family protein-serine/threonine phosphatase [Rhodoferax sp.]|jgi:serine/threonine protein phosphatase PrpC|uniref:PP2C family protein-serine/threonine phosphatase n=1 Tax=Rhodoferax sp. TaxID=50421 RepID=UPI0027245A01|nr:PP2C family serine/threonine-protein phosphatase [Rhodoferax sp.]MDO9144429.1 serine/threonine-protein phosphatase [Rhodoferax sp.]MDP1530817.1 serine/threonine-protein phosphatase [Rhodoferax sp.]MDP1945161.1 serine/threonine-protein phosphatase [Rhodoferax sp.]MDP2442890.1 serine/threonine-protein phosphatase [Rhodoferax sp.]MDP3191159.1 serine/threonine-protein phosphatase [Rhodoferax sp.]
MRFSVFQVSRQGGRKKNEDRMGYSYTSDSVLLMLADGMGGHPDGEVAAALTMETVAGLFQKMAQPQLDDVADFLTQALMAAHDQLLHYAAERDMSDTPRTTLVMAVIQSGQVRWTHCGDSRFYLIRQQQLLTRTQDHSFTERGRHPYGITTTGPAEPNRNVLFTCLGSPIRPVFSVTEPLSLQQGDTLMLCSDGLWASVPEQDIVAVLNQKPAEKAVPDLVEKALQQAGDRSDNVSCLALNWLTPAAPINTIPGNPRHD